MSGVDCCVNTCAAGGVFIRHVLLIVHCTDNTFCLLVFLLLN